MAKEAASHAKKQFFDVLIVDTAGRLHIDSDMMEEIKQLQKQLTPIETLFVVDSMTGQDAAHTAKAFHETLDLTGVILTKTDGDARGGAAHGRGRDPRPAAVSPERGDLSGDGSASGTNLMPHT